MPRDSRAPAPAWHPGGDPGPGRSARPPAAAGQPGAAGPPAFDRETRNQRNAVEWCINRMKHWRGIATRYERTATLYLCLTANRFSPPAVVIHARCPRVPG
ncbi:transposase [Streptomyces sp. D2-8]|nr:transposase [Streptomyces sp. D2-8]